MALPSPNPWTPATRYTVIAWFAVGLVWSAAGPFWLTAPVADSIVSIFDQTFGPPTAADLEQASAQATTLVWSWAVVTALVDVLVIAGAVRRWGWAYNLVIVLWALWSVTIVAYLPSIPGWFAGEAHWQEIITFAFSVLTVSLAGWMLAASLRRGLRP